MFKKGAKPLEKSQFIDTGTSMNGDLDINKNIQNFVEYLLNPETQQRIASIDAELGTKYGEAAKRFVRRYNNGELLVYPRNKGDIGSPVLYSSFGTFNLFSIIHLLLY